MLSPDLVVFDLDDTLLDHRAAERDALADLHAQHPEIGRQDLPHVQDTYHACNAPLWRDFAAGTLSAADLKRRRWTDTLKALRCETLDPGDASRDYLDRYAAHWRWTPGARDAYLSVTDAYPVALLTNGFSAQQRGKLARFPELEDRASTVVISEEVGVMKPDPRVFEIVRQRAAEALDRDIAPASVLYVGDSFRSDVQGGLAAGWRVAWYHGEASAPAGVVSFDRWRALLEALGL
ncbi:MAG: HAD-IA family hydrolase [Bacteroidota bacterium]